MKKIIIDKCEIAYSEEKTGKLPVVFIHGFNSSSISFKALVNQQNRNYDMILLDMPGNGRSKTNEPLSIELYNKIVKKLLDKIGRKKYILFGHSLGGATVAALSKNENILKGILAAPLNPFLNDSISVSSMKKMLEPKNINEAITSIKDLVENKEKEFYFNNIDSSAKSFLNFIKNSENKYSHILNNQILSRDYQAGVLYNYYNQSKDKLQIIIGKEDLFVPLESIEKVSSEFNIKFEVINNCGHSIVYEQPEKINSFLNETIKENFNEDTYIK